MPHQGERWESCSHQTLVVGRAADAQWQLVVQGVVLLFAVTMDALRERAIVLVREHIPSATKAEIRRAYKALVKVLHPDMNGGDRSQEEQLSEVVWAWDQIKDSRFFKD